MGVERVQRPGVPDWAMRFWARPALPDLRGWCRTVSGGPIAWRLGVVSVWGLVLAGCAAPHTPYPRSFNSFRPEERIQAARHAAEIHDRQAIPLLVDRLEDDDSAVRLFTILSLEKLTGTRLGYEYRSDDVERARAVQRWRRYVAEWAATQPASATGPVAATKQQAPSTAKGSCQENKKQHLCCATAPAETSPTGGGR